MNDGPSPDDALDLEAEIDIQAAMAALPENPPELDPQIEEQLRRRLGPPER